MRAAVAQAPSAAAALAFLVVIIFEVIHWRMQSLIGFSNRELAKLLAGLLVAPIAAGALSYLGCYACLSIFRAPLETDRKTASDRRQ
jgi:hypothetical protein